MRNFASNLGTWIPITSRNIYSGVMFLGKKLFREYYSLGIKFREQVFLGIFFEGVFLPLAQNSGAFFPIVAKKNRAFARSRKTPSL